METTKLPQPQELPPTETETTATELSLTETETTATANSTSTTNNTSMFLSRVLPKPAPGTAVRVYLLRHGETHWNTRGKIQGGGYDVPLNATGKEQARKAAAALAGIPLDAVASSSLSRARDTADIVFERLQKSRRDDTKETRPPLRIVDGGFNEMRFGKFEGFGYRTKGGEGAKGGVGEADIWNEARLAIFLAAKTKVAQDRECCFPSRGDVGSDHGGGEHDDDKYWSVNADDEVFRIENDSGKGESTRNVEERALEALSDTIARVLAYTKDPNTTPTTTKHVAIVSHGRTNKVMISAMLSRQDKIGQGNTSISVLDHSGLEVGGNADGDDCGNAWKKGWTARLLNYTDHIEGR